MHGDADAETKETRMYAEQDEYHLLEMIELIQAAWELGDDINESYEIQKALEAYCKENDIDEKYPSDLYTDMVGYDVTDHSGQFLATPQCISIIWFDEKGHRYPVHIEKDGVEHERLYHYT